MDIPLHEYIRKTIEEINLGLPNQYVIEETIDFEVSITTSTDKEGGIEIKVFSGGIRKEKESVQTVYFSVANKADKKKSAKALANDIIKYTSKGLQELSKLSGSIQQEQYIDSSAKSAVNR